MNEPSPISDAVTPDRPPPLGSWRRAYAFVVVFFIVEVLLFSWLTWSVA